MSNHDSVPLEVLLGHRAFVTALARALVRDPGAADDLEQQAWVAAIERPPSAGGSVRGWFARVMRNARRDAWRSGVRRERREADAPPRVPESSPDEIVARAEIHRRVVLAVFALEEPYRGTVILRFFEGLDATQIAAREGVPPATVRKRLERALDRLRQRLDADCDGDRGAWIAALAPLSAALPTTGDAPQHAPAPRCDAVHTAAAAPIRRWGMRVPAATAGALLVAGLCAAVWGLIGIEPDGGTTAQHDDVGRIEHSLGLGNGGAQPAGSRQHVADTATAESSADTAAVEPEGAAVEPSPAADVSVTVLTAAGDPAVGATVTALRVLHEPSFVVYSAEIPDPPAMPVAARAVTGADGRATLTGLVQATHFVTADADGHAPAQSSAIRPGDEPREVRMVLRRGGVVTGRVTDASTGAPADAEVVAGSMQDVGFGCDAARRRTRTAPDGTYRIESVPQGSVVVSARRPGGFVAGGGVVALGDAARCDLRLAPVAPVAGRAIDDVTGVPVAGAALFAIVTSNLATGSSPTRASLVTGPGGRFELPGVPVGSTVRIVCSDEGPWRTSWPAVGATSDAGSMDVAGSETGDSLVVRLLRPAAIEGVVTTEDGRPAAGAEVLVIGDRRDVGSIAAGVVLATVRADASGRYRAGGLDPGRVEVFARCGSGHSVLPMSSARRAELTGPGREGDPRPVTEAGVTMHIDLRLIGGAEIRGRVVRADGSAAKGAWVHPLNRHVANNFAAEAITDAEGRFALHAVPVEGPPLVVGAWLGATRGRADVTDPAGEVTIRLDAPGATDIALSGRVVGPDGAPAPGARLVLVETPNNDDTEGTRLARYLDRSGSRVLPLRADGSFSVDRIDGRHRERMLLVAAASGLLPGATMVPVRPGARIADIRVVLRSGDVIVGVLRDAGGAPVAGMQVRAVPAPRGNISYGGTPPTAETGADGTFRLVVETGASVCICFGAVGEEVLALPSAPAGRGIVEARMPADARPRSAVDADALARARGSRSPSRGFESDDVPADSARVEGRVLGADGKGVEGADVRHVVRSERGRSSRGTSTDAGGRFSIPVPPGAVGTLEVDARERGVAVRDGVAAGAGAVEVRVSPRTEPVLRGVVRDADRAPVAGVVVTCIEASPGSRAPYQSVDVDDDGEMLRDRRDLRSVRTDADGAFCVASLPIGRWTLWAGRPGTTWTPTDVAEIDVVDGGQDATERDLRVERGHVLRVRLLDSDGQARRGARVYVTRARSTRASPVEFLVTAAADGDGIVEVTGLPPGPWRVSQAGAASAAVDLGESPEPIDVK